MKKQVFSKDLSNERSSKQEVHIAIHNPNTPEETAKYLAKLIIKNIVEKSAKGRINLTEEKNV